MRANEVIVIVRTPGEAETVKEAAPPMGAMRRVHIYVAGQGGAPTPSVLYRMRRAADLRRRRMPVLVWTDKAQAGAWRNAGAYVITAGLTKRAAAKAIDGALRVGNPWIESQNYVGPCRRRHVAWLKRDSRRLSDSAKLSEEGELDESPALATQLRQLQMGAVGIAGADRDRRAQFLSDVRRTAKAADRNRRMHVAVILESLARYIAAAGAGGRINEELVVKHLDVAEGPAENAAASGARLTRAVDQAIGLSQAS